MRAGTEPVARLLASLIAAAALALAPVQGMAAQADPAIAHALDRLMQNDARLQTVGWKLAAGNAAFCAETVPGSGLLLMDAANFRDPPAIRAALGLAGDIAVNAVAAGSPAESAGLRAGEEVLAIGGEAMQALPPVPAGDHARLAALQARLTERLAQGPVDLVVRGGDGIRRTLSLGSTPACRSRFELSGGGKAAVADGERVILREAELAILADDGSLMAVAAHELAHNLLRHRERLGREGRTPGAIRATEQEADRLGPWLIANAGYPPLLARSFATLRAFARPLDSLLPSATHGSWKGRARRIGAEVAAIEAIRRADPAAPLDWRMRFAASTP